VSAYEGDILILGSDGVFDNLFLDEIVAICNGIFLPGKTSDTKPLPASLLNQAAQRIVKDSHSKSDTKRGIYLDAPIGKGGKVDDTSVIVAEVVEWTDAHRELCSKVGSRRKRENKNGFSCTACEADDDEIVVKPAARGLKGKGEKAKRECDSDSESTSMDEEGDGKSECVIV